MPITAVCIEFDDGDNSPAPVLEHGFLLVMPSKRMALHCTAIDGHDDLVEQICTWY